MEDVVQRVFSILLSVIIFFLLPLYIAFEKKDDISYSFALKISTNFVDNVLEKGYLTMDMYNDFVTELSTTGNVYDISMQYLAKQYNPVIQIIGKTSDSDGKNVIVSEYDYLEKKKLFENYDKNNNRQIFNYETNLIDKNNAKAQVTYKLSERKYSTEQILEFLSGDNNNFVAANLNNYSSLNVNALPTTARIYGLSNEGLLVMNKGDQFSITIKNENTTIASVLFNTLTLGANSGNDTKVYVNYGGTVKNQEYKVDLIGDVNQDGIVNIDDFTLINDYLLRTVSFTTIQKISADIDRNGMIDNTDAILISTLSYYRSE